MYTDAQGNYCHYNKKGQLIRIIDGVSCLVDEYNRNLVSSTVDVPKLQQKFLSPAGIQYQVDNYGNMYTLVQNQKIPLDSKYQLDKKCQQPQILEQIANSQATHDFGTASTFYYKGVLMFLFDFTAQPGPRGLEYVEPSTGQLFRPNDGLIETRYGNSWVIFDKKGVPYSRYPGLYNTNQIFCTTIGGKLGFKDKKGRWWYVDFQNRRYYCCNKKGQIIMPSSGKELQTLNEDFDEEALRVQNEQLMDLCR